MWFYGCWASSSHIRYKKQTGFFIQAYFRFIYTAETADWPHFAYKSEVNNVLIILKQKNETHRETQVFLFAAWKSLEINIK